jgi:CheY-like chemotaxis protein
VPNPIAVLVVDDDAVSRAQLSALVRAAGYEVRTADHGREAWDALRVARIPVVISDWYMPELDGPELCRRIRARPNEPYVYFILVTARGGKEQYLAGMEAGADDFVAKPVDPDELRARLTVAQRILGLRRDLQQLEGLLPICTYCKQSPGRLGALGLARELHREALRCAVQPWYLPRVLCQVRTAAARPRHPTTVSVGPCPGFTWPSCSPARQPLLCARAPRAARAGSHRSARRDREPSLGWLRSTQARR